MIETYAVRNGSRWVAVHFDSVKNHVRAADTFA